MIEILDEYKQVDELVKGKAPLIFVTGGGGTGKSTFIKWLSDKYYGRVIKCAPTGIAALNISGKTIHSVFRLPPKFITKEDIKVLPSNQAKVIFNTDVIIIDEISMVTSNMLDAVDLFLQANMRSKKPFGGKTVIIVGDMFQLPPIVGTNVSDVYFKMYDTAYFFGANVMKQVDFEFIELQKVRRQKDDVFIDVLSNIRTGQNIKDSIDLLNERCRILIEPEPGSVVLSPRNNEVEARNNSELKRIRNVKEFSYDGVISGEFKNDRLPSPFFLDLKVGAQVSFTANLKEGIVNGTVGKVVGLYDDKVQVQVLSTSEIVTVEKYTWEEFTYKFNEYKKQVESKPCGTYEQIPLKLAWASTIHKCVSKDTLVETPKGKVSISDVKVGDYVNTGYGYRMITNKWNSGVKKSFKVKTKLGYELVCSDEHKLLTYVDHDYPSFKELRCVDTSHKVAISMKSYIGNDDWYREIYKCEFDGKSNKINTPMLDFDFGYFIGMYLSDGSITNTNKDKRIDITKSCDVVLNKLSKFISGIGINNNIYVKSDTVKSLYFNSTNFINLFDRMGLIKANSHQKIIPKNLIESNKEFRIGLLSGLFDGDGYVSKKKYVYTSMSCQLLKDIQELLRSVSVVSYIDDNNQLHVTGNSSIILANVLELYHNSKADLNAKNRLEPYSRSNNDLVSFVKGEFPHKKGVVTTRHLALGSTDKNISLDIYYDSIDSIVAVEDVEMYDIEVDDHHSFVANNIIVHNCQGVSLDKVHIDLGAGCFATGQLYVALSRCRTLDGITLSRKLTYDDVSVDDSIISFYEDCRAGNQDFSNTGMSELFV